MTVAAVFYKTGFFSGFEPSPDTLFFALTFWIFKDKILSIPNSVKMPGDRQKWFFRKTP
jgi:hypothetical protein